MFGMNIKQEGISIEGDQTEFARWTHIWRRVRKYNASMESAMLGSMLTTLLLESSRARPRCTQWRHTS